MSRLARPLMAWTALPLAWKLAAMALAIGCLAWFLLDRTHAAALDRILRQAAEEELVEDVLESRHRLHRLLQETSHWAALYQLQFNAHPVQRSWNDDAPHGHTHAQPPDWLLSRDFAPPPPDEVLLIDGAGRVREYYQDEARPLPAALLHPSSLLLARSDRQTLLTRLDGNATLLSSRPLTDGEGRPAGQVLVTNRIDERFLARLSPHPQHLTVVLLDDAADPRILASGAPDRIAPGLLLGEAAATHLVSGPIRLDHGASEFSLKMAFLSPAEADQIVNQRLLTSGRWMLLLTALVPGTLFLILMMGLVRRINRLQQRVGRLVEESAIPTDGPPAPFSCQEPRGDELQRLEWRFMVLRQQILASQRHLRRQTAQSLAILENLADGVILMDLQGIMVVANPATLRMFGHEQLVGQPVTLLLPPPLRGRLARLLQHQRLPRLARLLRHPLEILGQRADGVTFPLELRVSLILLEELQLLVVVARDLTASKEAQAQRQLLQEELAHTQRLLTVGELVSGLAHELNQPLAAIVNYARGAIRRLEAGAWTAAETTPILERIVEQAQRIGSVVRNLRHFLRRGSSTAHPTDLTQILSDVLTLADFQLGKAGVAVRVELDSHTPPLHLDSIQIQQVLLNLLANAMEALLDATIVPRQITVRSHYDASQRTVTCSVTDNGPGIPPAVAERIFDPFFTTKNDGMGLGLSISRSIIEHHGGSLWLKNDPGHGATLGFTLPVIEEARHVHANRPTDP